MARWCVFGHFGSALIGLIIAISMLGWFGVQNSVLANSLDYVLSGWLGFKWSAIFLDKKLVTQELEFVLKVYYNDEKVL